MRTLFTILLTFSVAALALSSCSQKAGTESLSPKEFAAELEQNTGNAILLDVRTPQEFEVSRIEGSLNIDVNSPDFEKQAENLDKGKTLYLYCLSGSRTAEAAEILGKKGYTVKILQQGLMGWKNQGLPVQNTDPKTGERRLSVKEQFNELIKGDKLVMVDFYADWCRPCKMMEPYVNRVKQERADDVIVLKIDTDNEPELSNKYKISSIPTLILFKNDQVLYNQAGFHDYNQLSELINTYK